MGTYIHIHYLYLHGRTKIVCSKLAWCSDLPCSLAVESINSFYVRTAATGGHSVTATEGCCTMTYLFSREWQHQNGESVGQQKLIIKSQHTLSRSHQQAATGRIEIEKIEHLLGRGMIRSILSKPWCIVIYFWVIGVLFIYHSLLLFAIASSIELAFVDAFRDHRCGMKVRLFTF